MKNILSMLMALSMLAYVCVGCAWLPSFIGDRGKLIPSFALSPDGKQLAISANDGDLYLVDLDSKKVTRLTETPAYEKRPSFSPDGRSLVYVSEPAGDRFSSRVFQMQIDTRETKQLTSDRGICDNNPHYSRDGSRIVFTRASRNNGDPNVRDLWNDYDLYVMNADGSGQKRITNGLYQRELDARFAPDGTSVVFTGQYLTSASTQLTSDLLRVRLNDGAQNPVMLVSDKVRQQQSLDIHNSEFVGIDVSPDGDSALVSVDRKIRLFDFDKSTFTALHAAPPGGNGSFTDPAFTPDGKRAFMLSVVYDDERRDSIYTLWSVDIDGKNLKQFADASIFANPLEWRPK